MTNLSSKEGSLSQFSYEGHDLTELLSNEATSYSFDADIKNLIPNSGSIVYSVWSAQGDFLYIGIAGLQKDPAKRSPRSRMISHASGVRSGDQFCVYIQDLFVIPELVKSGAYTPEKGQLDRMTKDYIRTNLTYRYMLFDGSDSHMVVRKIEKAIQNGQVCGLVPSINGVRS